MKRSMPCSNLLSLCSSSDKEQDCWSDALVQADGFVDDESFLSNSRRKLQRLDCTNPATAALDAILMSGSDIEDEEKLIKLSLDLEEIASYLVSSAASWTALQQHHNDGCRKNNPDVADITRSMAIMSPIEHHLYVSHAA
jgi:hypothetical protein